MAGRKIATLNLRIDPTVKDALRIAAQKERRSIANLIEVLIRDHCALVGIPVPEQEELFQDPNDE